VKIEFLEGFSKYPRLSNFMKIRPVGPDLLHADGQTDRHDEGNSRFSQFCNSVWKWGHFWTERVWQGCRNDKLHCTKRTL